MRCQRCDNDFAEQDIQEHHIHCRFLNNPKGQGKKIYLCEKCHNILHLLIPVIIFNHVPDKMSCIDDVIRFTDHWIKDNLNSDVKKEEHEHPKAVS